MYSPKIRESLIRTMYRIKLKTGKPMTQQVNEAVTKYVKESSSDNDLMISVGNGTGIGKKIKGVVDGR